MARLRTAPSAQQPALPKRAAGRPALKEKTNTIRTNAHVYEDDGDTEGLVKNAKPKRGRPRKTQQDSDELVMAGGLGASTSQEVSAMSEPLPTTDELAKSDNGSTPAPKPNKRPPRTVRKVVQSEAQSKVLDGLKKRMNETANGQKAKQKARTATADVATNSSSDEPDRSKQASSTAKPAVNERSEFSLSPSPPAPGKLSAVKSKRTSMVQPGSALRTQGTPAIDSSLFALRNFKRRPRQPSMLQMVQQRTASTRTSMVNTAVDSTASDDASGFDLDTASEEEDDFAPEAEGTPLHVRKAKRLSAATSTLQSQQPTATSTRTSGRKRKSDLLDASTSSIDKLQAKRRRSMAAEIEEREDAPLSSQTVEVPATQSSSDRPETPQPPITSDVLVANSPSTSTPPTEPASSQSASAAKAADFAIPSTERDDAASNHEQNDDGVNVTMADPLSSSPARNGASQADHLAYPLTQISPVAPQAKRKRNTKPISTATLQSLLPKKRAPLRTRHRKSEYDFETDSDEDAPLDASHLEEEEDELGGRLRRPARTTPAKKTKRGRQTKSASTARQALTARGRGKSAVPRAKKGQRTYGRGTASDKENEEHSSNDEDGLDDTTLPEVSLSMQEVSKCKEIEEAKRKFAEIDQWSMQYETVNDEDHRSSSQDWR